MVRALLLTAAAVLMLGAARPPSVDYRLGAESVPGQPPVLDVEIRLRGDADGETRLRFPRGLAGEPRIEGARSQTPEPDVRSLRHRPGAGLTLRYEVRPPGGDASGVAALGENLFATPEGRAAEAATFRWARLPEGWRGASDLEHGASGRPMTVADIQPSVLITGARVQIATRAVTGGVIRVALLGDPAAADRLADTATPAIAAIDRFWGDATGPYLIVAGPFLGAPGTWGTVWRSQRAHCPTPPCGPISPGRGWGAWIPARVGQAPTAGDAPAWFQTGFSDLFAGRLLLRAGQLTPKAAVADLDDADRSRDPGRRGVILALKWDEDIRRKTAGKADLSTVLLRMREHFRQFGPGQGPDTVTGLVSAAWVVARLDLRPDIARYAQGGAPIPLPETLFEGCLDARVTVSPGFDAGFDAPGSFAARTVRGVRRGGPAWNSGLRNGMALETWRFTAGDMSREIELRVRPASKRAKGRLIRFWPYGDADVETRRLALAVGLSETRQAACARALGGVGADRAGLSERRYVGFA